MAKAPAKAKKVVKPAPKKPTPKKPAPKPVAKKVTKPAPKKEAKPVLKKEVKPVAVAKKPVVVAKPAAKVAPAKVIAPVVDKKKLEKEKQAKEKELKAKGKKGKEPETFEEELELSSSKRSDEDEDEDDDLFSEKKNSKNKAGLSERLKKEEDLPTQKMFNLSDYFQWKEIQASLENLDFFLPKDDACMQRLCENIRTTGPYCRLHYIANWKLMQQKKEILKEGKLQTLIEDFVTKYPANFIQAVLDDLDSDREFHRVLTELNISDTEFDVEEVAVAVEDEDDDTIDFESRSMDTFKPGGFEEE
jgi:hypothetical protein